MENVKILCELASSYIGQGELFISRVDSSSIIVQNSEVKNVDFFFEEGLSLRHIDQNEVYFIATSDLSYNHMKTYVLPKLDLFLRKKPFKQVLGFHERALYPTELNENSIAKRIELLREMDSYLRRECSLFSTITIRESCSNANVSIYTTKGLAIDRRPLFSLSISATIIKKNSQLEGISVSFSKRHLYSELSHSWKGICDELIRKALVISDSKPFSGGTLPVILGPGIPATLLHEAVGHGLEADFIGKNTSVFEGKLGHKIASDLVTVVDDGTIPCSRGTLNFDDEGTPTQRTVLIENGVLVNFMHDKYTALKMNKSPTGNGRRESYSHQPMPRMTNTILLNGNSDLKSMIESIDNGIMAMDFGTGQVDITSGQFSFNGSEAYKITNGKIDYPISKCAISGMGSEVMQNIRAVGNDFKMDPSGGTCGKEGQSVPVNLGQPSVMVSNMVVG